MFEKQKNSILMERNRRLNKIIDEQRAQLDRYRALESSMKLACDTYNHNAEELSRLKADYLSMISDLRVLRAALPNKKRGGD